MEIKAAFTPLLWKIAFESGPVFFLRQRRQQLVAALWHSLASIEFPRQAYRFFQRDRLPFEKLRSRRQG